MFTSYLPVSPFYPDPNRFLIPRGATLYLQSLAPDPPFCRTFATAPEMVRTRHPLVSDRRTSVATLKRDGARSLVRVL